MSSRHAVIREDTLVRYARQRIAAARHFPRHDLLQRTFPMPFLDVDCWSSEPALPDLCQNRLARRADDAPARSRAEIFLLDATCRGWEAPALWDVSQGLTSRELETTLENAALRGFYHHEAPSWQFYDPALKEGVHTLPSPMAIPPWESGSPLRLFLHWAYAHMGMRLTHAATLGIGGTGALIVGASGSGKSGTTISGLLHGLESVGDDYVLLEQGEELTAHAVFRVLKQDSSGLRRVGLDPDRIGATAVNWQGKHEFDAQALQPCGFLDRLCIRCIIVPERARLDRTCIEPLSAAKVALALAPSAVLQLQGDTREGFRFFAELSRRLPAFKVRLSEDPLEIADAIGNHLLREVATAN